MMKIQEIRVMAKNVGIKTARMTKANIIHAIQLNEGNFNCFATATQRECNQYSCLWRGDCFTAAQK